eukprot:g683.t1
MADADASHPLPASPSLLFNNLVAGRQGIAYVHRDTAVVMTELGDSASRRIKSAESKPIMSCLFMDLSEGPALVLATVGGVQVWSVDGAYMLYTYAIEEAAGLTMPADHDIFARGLASGDGSTLSVGTSMGEIITFSIDSRDKFTVTDILKNHKSAIASLGTDGDCMAR